MQRTLAFTGLFCDTRRGSVFSQRKDEHELDIQLNMQTTGVHTRKHLGTLQVVCFLVSGIFPGQENI